MLDVLPRAALWFTKPSGPDLWLPLSSTYLGRQIGREKDAKESETWYPGVEAVR